ncbi:DUF6602 domain-containing protein [Pseudomonas sp. CR3202]|uniref:DUF6602 domain-containing protein n=1 Tax=Pseudomonas sp. CR3202 TaxID=3351532 RepID=UPI003BF2C787
MSQYFEYIGQELHSKIMQAKAYITRHNPTTGALAEEVLRQFLKEHLPQLVSVNQGFILDKDGGISKQCDILIYDAHLYAPFYQVGGLVVVPAEAVIAVLEVKTSINKKTFHDVIRYFASFEALESHTRTYLFMFNAPKLALLHDYFDTYPHLDGRDDFDHDTFHFLPDEITGLDRSYHLERNYVIHDRDGAGYLSYFFEDLEGMEINALELFFLSLYRHVEAYITNRHAPRAALAPRDIYHKRQVKKVLGIDLFPM